MSRFKFIWLGLLLCSCAASAKIEVNSNSDTNGGRPFYVMVRKVDAQTIVAEDYQTAATKVFSNPRDPSVITSEAIFPGQPLRIDFERPETGDIGLYFFFTEHGEKWRVPLNAPIPSIVIVELGKNQIKRVQVRR